MGGEGENIQKVKKSESIDTGAQKQQEKNAEQLKQTLQQPIQQNLQGTQQIKTDATHVKDIVIKTISSHTKSDFDQVKVASECVKKLQELYNTKCIVEMMFTEPFLA